MRKRLLSSVLAVLSTAALFACLCLTPTLSETPESFIETVEEIVSPAEYVAETKDIAELPETDALQAEPEARDFTEEELKVRFTNLLNINYCYNDNFQNDKMLAICSAISLSEYATDIPGYGIGVGENLVSTFAVNFYGKTIDFSTLNEEELSNGYVLTPSYSVGTQSHTIVSITATETGYEVVSMLELYYGGNDCETAVSRSVFETTPSSEFSFNLVSCELS